MGTGQGMVLGPRPASIPLPYLLSMAARLDFDDGMIGVPLRHDDVCGDSGLLVRGKQMTLQAARTVSPSKVART